MFFVAQLFCKPLYAQGVEELLTKGRKEVYLVAGTGTGVAVALGDAMGVAVDAVDVAVGCAVDAAVGSPVNVGVMVGVGVGVSVRVAVGKAVGWSGALFSMVYASNTLPLLRTPSIARRRSLSVTRA